MEVLMEEKPNYYAVIPAEIRYDKELTANEKILYGEITALTNKNGECWAGNEYFANLYKVKNRSVSRWISHLKEKRYITISLEYKNDTKEINKRIIKINGIPIDKNVKTYRQNCQEGIDKNVLENNTSINNKENINNKLFIQKKVFKKPTIEEIKEYCLERKNNISAEAFYDFYETNGWVQGKGKPIKDWKACVRTWEQRNKPKEEKLPDWWNKTNKDFEKEVDDEIRAKAEAIRNGTYKA